MGLVNSDVPRRRAKSQGKLPPLEGQRSAQKGRISKGGDGKVNHENVRGSRSIGGGTIRDQTQGKQAGIRVLGGRTSTRSTSITRLS
jgi:hypothetical protein